MFKNEPKYIFYAGKGGVGKTSCAAAAALSYSKKGKKTLILSTDPAHSLSDSFRKKIGGDVKKLKENLYAVEIDPKKAIEEYKEKLAPQMEKLEFLKGLGMDDMFDIAGNTPGIDEFAAFDKFMQFMQSGEYDIIVFDTAPTGHTLRFLSMPDVLDSWLGKMIKIKMKLSGFTGMFKKILPFGEQEEEKIDSDSLYEMKRRLEEAKKILTDKKKTAYNIVMIPENMSIYESERALETLKEYEIFVKSAVINQLIPINKSCHFCTEKRKIQQERIKDIAKRFKGLEIKQVPLFKEEVNGFPMLEKVAKHLKV